MNAPRGATPTVGGSTPLDKDAPTSIPMHTATFVAMLTFRGRDMFDSNKRCINSGIIELSVMDGTLIRTRCSHESDFKACDEKLAELTEKKRLEAIELHSLAMQSNGSALALGHHKPGHKKHKKKRTPMENEWDSMAVKERYSDLVSQLDLKEVTSTWNKALNIEFPTIRKFKGEGYLGDHVGVFIIPNKLSATKGRNFNVCKRVITNATTTFRDKYPGVTLASLEDHIGYMKGEAFINYNSPYIMCWNMEKFQNDKITGPHPNHLASNQVVMEEKKARDFLPLAKAEIAHHMSHGDVTKNFRVKIAVPIPHHRMAEHKLFLGKQQGGWEFQGFADKEYQYRGQDLTKTDVNNTYLDEWHHMNLEIHVKFLPDGAR